MKKSGLASGAAASKLIDERIESLDDWRGETLARLRAVVARADRGVVEEWKWNVPVWSCNGIICTGEVYKDKVNATALKALVRAAAVLNTSAKKREHGRQSGWSSA